MSVRNGVPQVELPTDYPNDIAFRMQHEQFLANANDMAEATVPQFGLQRVGLRFVSLVAVESETVAAAIDFGASIYAAATGVVTDPREYDSDTAQLFALQGVREFEKHIGFNEEKLIDQLKLAGARLETDAPRLTEVIDEVAGHYYHEKGLRDLAKLGAGAMRGFHILVNKRLIASQFSDDDADALLSA